ncbi:MAG: arsenate reductase ArsC [Candidatus Omnitrophica bacterium]|nr:arsenate reductase ArsC [Candidatus Omnitrophota bacterium]MDD5487584.1 arsenate reductase ArsC [Candidatus Omnitrophota bacterium]
MKGMQKVLFICIHNSARSQMAATFLNYLGGDIFEAESAGLEPGELNPIAVDVMKEIGIDISANRTRSVREVLESGKEFDHVITVCDESAAAKCPVFPGNGRKEHWSFDDPSTFTGTYEEKLEKTRKVRDDIRERIEGWIFVRVSSMGDKA